MIRKFDKEKDVATSAVIASAVIAVLFIFSGNIYVIASISNFGLLFSYVMTGFAVVHFRRSKKSADFKIPFYPYSVVVGIVGSLVFILGMPKESLEIGLIMIISLLIVYYFLREYRSKKVVMVKLFR